MRYETSGTLTLPKIGFGTWQIGGRTRPEPALRHDDGDEPDRPEALRVRLGLGRRVERPGEERSDLVDGAGRLGSGRRPGEERPGEEGGGEGESGGTLHGARAYQFPARRPKVPRDASGPPK